MPLHSHTLARPSLSPHCSRHNLHLTVPSSQFYITFKETRHLDGKHVVFGRLVSGLAVLRKIAAVDTNSQDCPRSHVIIERCGSIQLLGDGEQVGPPLRRCTWHMAADALWPSG